MSSFSHELVGTSSRLQNKLRVPTELPLATKHNDVARRVLVAPIVLVPIDHRMTEQLLRDGQVVGRALDLLRPSSNHRGDVASRGEVVLDLLVAALLTPRV